MYILNESANDSAQMNKVVPRTSLRPEYIVDENRGENAILEVEEGRRVLVSL